MQAEGNCSAIQYVQSMEIVPTAHEMWVLDVGRRNFLDAPFSKADNSCPPKLLIIDMETGRVNTIHEFPDQVASHSESFLNDIVVDVPQQIAFISDAGTGALVAYNRLSGRSRRFADLTTKNEPDFDFTIDGIHYGNKTFTTPADGIALLPDRSRVVYCALQGSTLWSVSSHILADPSSSTAEIQLTQLWHGRKASASDGLAFDCAGTLWFGGLTTDALYTWPYATNRSVGLAHVVVQNPHRLHWIDTFAFDLSGRLYATTNKLDTYFARTMSFTPGESPNFHVVRFGVGRRSYMLPCT